VLAHINASESEKEMKAKIGSRNCQIGPSLFGYPSKKAKNL